MATLTSGSELFNTFRIHKLKYFNIPKWFTSLAPPSAAVNNACPTYSEVAAAVRRCRPGASACPMDQISIIIFKHCPILRTLLHHIISECWRLHAVPQCWRRGATILIYKKGDTNDPASFRPITLQPVMYKIFSTVYANAMYKFMSENNYLDRKIQKGFWKGTDGVTEHAEALVHMMGDAKRRQRSIIVTLLDLRNAFGSIHHNLIKFSLFYHHAPQIFIDLFNSVYSNSYITVAVNEKWTQPIRVERGVLQGDPSSPLLFNLCFNSLMLIMNQPQYTKLGYAWGPTSARPRQRPCSNLRTTQR